MSKYKQDTDAPFFIAKHPENQAYFRDIAIPKKFIKEVKSHSSITCAQCTKLPGEGIKMSHCAKCKIAWYCSKDCQKQHWPMHKQCCVEAKFSAPKLIRNFISNPIFATFIEISAILAFGLDKNPPAFDRPLLAQCDVCIAPNLTHYMGLITRSLSREELENGTEGMLQVKSFNAIPSIFLDRSRMEIWNYTTRANADQLSNHTVIVVDFRMGENEQRISVGVVIRDHSLEIVREGCGFQLESAIFPGKTNKPLTIDGCINFINTHIRADECNQTMMRKHMTKEDVEEYRRKAAESAEK